MAIGAVRVMAAGKAGLESLPYFVDELIAQGIPQLAPWARDHTETTGSKTDIDLLKEKTQGRLSEDWKSIYGLEDTPPGVPMNVIGDNIRVLLHRVNRLAVKASLRLADSPAQLGAWCRVNIERDCHDTYEMWERYKANKGYTGQGHHLAVVIPYCPEGPTSGTVGMFLGAALRKYFDEMGKSHELVVWGIEICPVVNVDIRGEGGTDSNNAFRGYVAREELLMGVPLSADADDETLCAPFDINIVFDGGNDKGVSDDAPSYLLQALDRAAAQTTACLLNGAAGKSNAEAEVRLIEGKRWNAYLTHVVSERSYGPASRYLGYQATLPWHRDPDVWESSSVEARKDAFLLRIDNDVQRRLKTEQNSLVKECVGHLVALAETIRAIPLEAKWNNFLTKNRQAALLRVDQLLSQAINDEKQNYEDICAGDQAPNNVTPQGAPFCINLQLPEEQRRRAALESKDNGIPAPILNILGDAGNSTLRTRLTQLCEEVLRRSDCDPLQNDSSAFFDAIITVSMGDWSRGGKRLEFDMEGLDYLVRAGRRNIPNAFVDIPFDISQVVSRDGVDAEDQPNQPASLKWKLQGVDHDVPVEYSLMVLARVREGEGFRDITAYDRLRENYEKTIGDKNEWRERARYYGVKPPPELLDDYEGGLQSVDADGDGQTSSAYSAREAV